MCFNAHKTVLNHVLFVQSHMNEVHVSPLSLAVDIVSDIIQNPILGEREIDRERSVILREMKVQTVEKAC